jgi:N-acetylglucosamine-6-phosphate deacetylase
VSTRNVTLGATVDVVGRRFDSGQWVKLKTLGRRISELSLLDPCEQPAPEKDEWLAPAFWDIQTNGRWGISFSDPTLTSNQVISIVRAQAGLGTARLCPTLITAENSATTHGLRTIAAACESDSTVATMVAGIHLEGPYISPLDGYRGAHPLCAVREPDWEEFRAWQEFSGGRIVLVTLAPEQPGALEFIEKAVASGVHIAIGHTAANGSTIQAAISAGATLSTHLGNGIASPLPRHPNAILEQAADDRLFASLIADGHHLDPATLRVLVRAKTPERVILVSDASPLAGLPPGPYGPWAVDPSGKIVVAGTSYLAGSNQGLETGLTNIIRSCGLPLAQALKTVTSHPAGLLGFEEPRIAVGIAANLVRLRLDPVGGVDVIATCVDGEWFPA